MSLTSIELIGYRGFSQRGMLDFAVPTGEPGSGLTVLTGPNNAGKSSILESLRVRGSSQPPSFTSGMRYGAIESVEIKYTINGKDEFIRSVMKGSSETKKYGVDQGFQVFVLPSRRAFAPYFTKGELSREQYASSSFSTSQRSSILTNFEYRLFTMAKEPEVFNTLLHEALGFKPNWTIDQTDQGQYFLKFFRGSNSHSSDGLGEGIVSIFSIVDALYDSKEGNVVVVDEPELSLHPALQKRVAAMLNRYAANRQIVISTHSPYFVDLRALGNGGHLARIVSSDDGTRIHQLTPASKEAINRLAKGNRYNPHVFGLDARELFFQEDGIVLTEGQEDVLLYPRVAEQLGMTIPGSFFGWGAGGVDNIAHLCRILADLGFTKVAALIDGDVKRKAHRLESEFPQFFFGCIAAKDIRTKPARGASAQVEGLLDENLLIKPEFVDSTRQLLGKLSAYIAPFAD